MEGEEGGGRGVEGVEWRFRRERGEGRWQLLEAVDFELFLLGQVDLQRERERGETS